MNKYPQRLKYTLLFALTIRLCVGYFVPGFPYDIESYRIVGELIVGGEDFYSLVPSRYPYLPGWSIVEGLIYILSVQSGIDFDFAIKLPSIIADVTNCALIYKIIDDSDLSISPVLGAFYHAINPIAIIVIAAHGMFDSIPILFTLLAAFYLTANYVQSAIILGIGIIFKQIPILFGLVFALKNKGYKKLSYIIYSALPTLLITMPFVLIFEPWNVINAIVSYSGGAHIGWYSSIIVINQGLQLFGMKLGFTPGTALHESVLTISKIIVISLVLLVSTLSYKYNIQIYESVSAIILVFYLSSASLSPQYLYWFVPFSILTGISRKNLILWNVASLILIVIYYLSRLEMTVIGGSNQYLVYSLLLISNFAFLAISLVCLIDVLPSAKIQRDFKNHK